MEMFTGWAPRIQRWRLKQAQRAQVAHPGRYVVGTPRSACDRPALGCGLLRLLRFIATDLPG